MEAKLKDETNIKEQIFEFVLSKGDATEGEIIKSGIASKPTVLKYLRQLLDEKRVMTKTGMREFTQERALVYKQESGEVSRIHEEKTRYKRKITVYYVPNESKLRHQVIKTMPENLEEVEVPPDDIRKVYKEKIDLKMANRILNQPKPIIREKLRALEIQRELNKALHSRVGEAIATSKIILAYPPDDPIEFPRELKKKLISGALDIIDSVIHKETLRFTPEFRKKPCRVIIEYIPSRFNPLRDIVKVWFQVWMKYLYPETETSEEEIMLAMDYTKEVDPKASKHFRNKIRYLRYLFGMFELDLMTFDII